MTLESSPPGGVSDQQLWVVQQIAQAGGHVYYLRADRSLGNHKRYAYQHGKFWVLDGRVALIGSENPNSEAFPDDDKADGTLGRRGVYLVTDAPAVVAGLQAYMDADAAPVATKMYGLGTTAIRPWARRRPALSPIMLPAAASIRSRSRSRSACRALSPSN